MTIHKTPINKAEEVFKRQAGLLLQPTYFSRLRPKDPHDELDCEEYEREACKVLKDLVEHDIALYCSGFERANYDIVVEGLGWASVQGRGPANFKLYLPPGINYHIREKPMQPFEANSKGLKRYTGNTINSKTKRNLNY